MRDKKRIRAFCNRLADAWECCPDLRFGQFMMNVFGRMGKDPFFPEDDEMIRCNVSHFLGSYENIEDAVKAREQAEKELFGEFLPLKSDNNEWRAEM